MFEVDVSKTVSFEAGEAMPAGRFVKMSGATVVFADAGEDAVGVTLNAAAAGEPVTVALPGQIVMVQGSGAGVINARVSAAADGESKATATGNIVLGMFIETASDGPLTAILFAKNGVGA